MRSPRGRAARRKSVSPREGRRPRTREKLPSTYTATFDRATAVDADKECGSLVRGALFTGLPQPAQPSGLVFDGSELWYTESNYTDRIVSIDPATGSPGAPLTIPNAYVHAAQGADFWNHCNCGGSEEAFRVTRAGQTADEVRTPSELGEEISVQAIAFDAAAGVLWLHGWNDANQGRLMKVDAGGEPRELDRRSASRLPPGRHRAVRATTRRWNPRISSASSGRPSRAPSPARATAS